MVMDIATATTAIITGSAGTIITGAKATAEA